MRLCVIIFLKNYIWKSWRHTFTHTHTKHTHTQKQTNKQKQTTTTKNQSSIFLSRHSLYRSKSSEKTKVFLNWPLLELFYFCPKRHSEKDIASYNFSLWFLFISCLSPGHPLFIAAQCVPRWPWTIGRA